MYWMIQNKSGPEIFAVTEEVTALHAKAEVPSELSVRSLLSVTRSPAKVPLNAVRIV
jgi:hypothetical protein